MSPAPRRVGIMARHVSAPGGVTVFTKRVVRYLLTHAGDIEYHLLYSDPEEASVFADLPGKHVVLPSSGRLRWDQVDAPRYAEEQRLSLLLNCKFSVPLGCRIPTAVVIPGREQLAMAHVFPWHNRWYNRLLVPAFCRQATALITHTEVGRDDCEMMGARPENIYVVPHGVDPYLRPATEGARAAMREKYGLGRRYLLFLGGITPLKNIGNLLRAFAEIPKSYKLDLVLAGFKRWSVEQELAPLVELGLQDRVKLVGYVPDEDLAPLYSAAECLVLPSWYEGFGIPIVEAMACGCPVVTSSGRHAAPEVAGGAAMLVDPANPAAIAHGIRRVLDDPAVRQALIQRGLARGPQFCWEKTGRLTDAVIRELIARPTVPVPAMQKALAATVRAGAIAGSAVSERLMKGFMHPPRPGTVPSPAPQA